VARPITRSTSASAGTPVVRRVASRTTTSSTSRTTATSAPRPRTHSSRDKSNSSNHRRGGRDRRS